MEMLNLTQHPATDAQLAAGVFDPIGWDLHELKVALTFDTLPTADEIRQRADAIVKIAEIVFSFSESVTLDYKALTVMIGGAPYLMAPLERALVARGITPYYAYSVRESVEQTMPDGTVKKVNTFRHAGFVGAV